MSDYIVFIGRFQPYHLGHQAVLRQAISLAKKKVIVLIGSAYASRSIKNPFTLSERTAMILQDLSIAEMSKVTFKGLDDFKYNDLKWIEEVQSKVAAAIRLDGWTDYPPTVSMIGLDKDRSTQYLNWFPAWEQIQAQPFGQGSSFDATSIRRCLFSGMSMDFVRGVLPTSTFEAIEQLKTTEPWKNLVDEFEFVNTYKKSWAAAPYAPTFVTVDAVVFVAGHVLMIKRGANPGKGLWALPGGFLNQEELIVDAMIRELREETRLKVPTGVLRGSIFAEKVFDHPDRSLRGRTITHAFGINLKDEKEFPKVKGDDDAAEAAWLPTATLDRTKIFEDHLDIIQSFKGKL